MNKDSAGERFRKEVATDYESLVRIVAKLVHRRKDFVREAFHDLLCRLLGAFNREPDGSRRVGSWKPYLVRAIANEVRESRRRAARRRRQFALWSDLDRHEREKALSVPDPRPQPAELAARGELATLAWAELKTLPRLQREVVARRCQGQSFGAIAGQLSIKVSSAGVYWTRGLAALRTRFGVAA